MEKERPFLKIELGHIHKINKSDVKNENLDWTATFLYTNELMEKMPENVQRAIHGCVLLIQALATNNRNLVLENAIIESIRKMKNKSVVLNKESKEDEVIDFDIS